MTRETAHTPYTTHGDIMNMNTDFDKPLTVTLFTCAQYNAQQSGRLGRFGHTLAAARRRAAARANK